ncbi:MAG: hypothetical protein LBH24_04420, partial [Clostridiales bacterium]|nr:hypothetical protein [Clostridiales bacterium]
DTLTNSQAFELCGTEKQEAAADSPVADALFSKRAKTAFAIKFLNESVFEANRTAKKSPAAFLGYKKQKVSDSRKLIKTSDLIRCARDEADILRMADALQALSFRRTAVRAELVKLLAENKALHPYYGCSLPFSAAGVSRDVTVLIAGFSGAVSKKKTRVLDGLAAAYEFFEGIRGCSVAAVCLHEDAAAVRSALTEAGFTLTARDDGMTAATLIERGETRIRELRAESDRLLFEIVGFLKHMTSFKTLYDSLSAELEKQAAADGCFSTGETFLIEGFVPADRVAVLTDMLEENAKDLVMSCETVTEADAPPVLLRNNPIVRQFEPVTNMYSPPGYYEKDPNWLMAVFYFLIFGLMTADIGYGLVMILAAVFVVKLTRMERSVKTFMTMLGLCGVSAVAWGVLFGGFFSIEGLPVFLFSPIDAPEAMLVLCMAVGVVHILAGFAFHAYNLAKKKAYGAVVFDVCLYFVLFAGLVIVALDFLPSLMRSLPDLSLPGWLSTTGMILFLAAIGGIFLTYGRSRKGVFNKFLGGFAGLYGLINLFSDILSYARIFGLALAGAAIGQAFNEILGGIFGMGIAGYVLGGLLAVVMHAFNLAMGVLSAYVHNARLQFLEFYGKFYTGEGRLFQPLGGRTKYIRFE